MVLMEAEARPVQRAAKALALIFLAAATMALAVNVRQPFSTDFLSFWAAAVLGAGGAPVAAYDIAAHQAVQAQVTGSDGLLPFFYPPPFLLVLLPLGLLPYWAAAATWTIGTFAAYHAAARRLLAGSAWLVAAYPAVLVNAIIGQNAFLTAALFIAGLLALSKRPLLAGLLLGCLIIKPHLGVLLPLAFLAGGHWRAIAGASFSASGLLLLALLCFGPQSYAAWLGQAPVYASILSDGLVPWHKMASIYASLRHAGIGAALAWPIHIAFALVAAAAVFAVWRKVDDPAAKAAVLVPATLLVSPYLYLYDTVVLVVPFLWLIGKTRDPKLLSLLWCALLLPVAQNWVLSNTPNVTPLVTLALLLLVCRRIYMADGSTRRHELQTAELLPSA